MAEETLVATIGKSASERVHIRLSEYRGRPRFDARIFYNSGPALDDWSPSGKGINLPVSALPELHAAIGRAMEIAGVEPDDEAEPE